MTILRTLLLLFCFLISQNISAQSVISGTIEDSISDEALIGAYLKLSFVKDSTVYLGVSDYNGRFEISVSELGDYLLEISYVGYEILQIDFTVEDDTKLGIIRANAGSTLEEIEVVARQERVTQRGDTTQYNAAAYGTNPNATSEDLLQKMPGFVVIDGKMQIQGEEVKKILVNGKPFFGNDPEMALKNLPAEVIAQIQVYDQSSEQAEEEGGSPGEDGPKTINIILKEENNKGSFGNAYSGYGTDNRYRAGANMSYLKEDRKINVLANFNNVNQQNFSSSNLSKNNRNRIKGGINSTNSAGINYQDEWGDKIDLSGSYFFNQSENVNETKLRRDFFNRTLPFYFEEISNDESNNLNHRANARLRYKINDKNSLLISPSFSSQSNTGSSTGTTRTFNSDSLSNALADDFRSNAKTLNFSNRLAYTRKFKKKKRSLQFSFRNNLKIVEGENFTTSINLLDSEENPVILDQKSISKNVEQKYSAGFSFTESVGKNGRITTGYTYGNDTDESDIETTSFDDLNNDYLLLENDLSSRFESNYLSHKGELTYRYKRKNLNYKLRGFYQSADLKNEQSFPAEVSTTKNFSNFLPQASLRYNISKTKNLRINLRTRTKIPRISELQDVVDNSNPLRVSAGNSNLRQAVNYNLDLKYSANNSEKETVFFALLRANFAENYISRSLTLLEEQDTIKNVILPAGAQYRTSVNSDGYFQGNAFVSFGMPLTKLKSNLNLNVGLQYKKVPSLLNSENIFTHTQNVRTGITLGSNINENIDFTLKTTSLFNFAQLENTDNTQVFSQITSAVVNWIFAKKWQINSSVTHRYYETFGADPIDDYILWNAGFAYKFLPKERAELGISLYDILNSNTAIHQYYNENSYTQTESLTLTRYFMLTLRYNLRAFKN